MKESFFSLARSTGNRRLTQKLKRRTALRPGLIGLITVIAIARPHWLRGAVWATFGSRFATTVPMSNEARGALRVGQLLRSPVMANPPALLRLRRSRRPRVADPELELADIQGNILRPYGFQHACFLFVHVDEAAAGRRWLAERTDEVTSAEPWEQGKPLTTLNIRLTYPGLEALGVPESMLASFPEAFRAGMAGRAALLGDIGPNSPAEWEHGLGTGEAHILLRIDSQEPDALTQEVNRLRQSVEGVGTIVTE